MRTRQRQVLPPVDVQVEFTSSRVQKSQPEKVLNKSRPAPFLRRLSPPCLCPPHSSTLRSVLLRSARQMVGSPNAELIQSYLHVQNCTFLCRK